MGATICSACDGQDATGWAARYSEPRGPSGGVWPSYTGDAPFTSGGLRGRASKRVRCAWPCDEERHSLRQRFQAAPADDVHQYRSDPGRKLDAPPTLSCFGVVAQRADCCDSGKKHHLTVPPESAGYSPSDQGVYCRHQNDHRVHGERAIALTLRRIAPGPRPSHDIPTPATATTTPPATAPRKRRVVARVK